MPAAPSRVLPGGFRERGLFWRDDPSAYSVVRALRGLGVVSQTSAAVR